MPLGSVSKFNYVQQEFSLAPGDVLLLMTDGFAERFNCEGEMLGEEKASEVLAAAARLPAPEIIARLVSIGDEWAGEQQQDDDVTFVVMKVIVPCASNSSA
jgi:sigma-B regulation protein RsbU (phosphoserine phosphatase)